MTDSGQSMLYRRFGRTNLQMPVFSCGGMRYQHHWTDLPPSEVPKANQDNLEATIRRAVELGINHIETARGYGSSERQLGQILPTFARDKLIVQTKIGPEDDPDKFLAHFDESLERLQLDYVDLLGLHGLNDQATLDKAIRKGGCLAAARKLQQQGKARHIGFSTHGSTDTIRQAIAHTGDGGFDYVNLHWYYIFQRNWSAVLEARQRDMGVFIISPSDKGGKLYDPPDELVQLCEPLHPMVFNDLFCLAHPQVHTLSIGAARPTDFDMHVKTLPLIEHADHTLAPILARLREAMHEATGVDDPEAMSAGLPEWDAMPGQLNVAVMLWLRNLALGWGMTEYAKMRYNLLGNAGHWFPGGKPDNLQSVTDEALIEAAGDSPWAQQIPDMLRESVDLLRGEEVQRASKGG
ncbi:MAG: aldo/keto reductase, partial [Phycisphaeraceae bacterium]